MRTTRLAAVVGAAATASACMSRMALPRAPHMALPAFDEGPQAAYNGVCHGASCKPGHDASRYQYFDERHRRYYFFDPKKKQYFWANGEPKT